MAGGYRERVAAEVSLPCKVGTVPDFGKGGRKFTVDEVGENSISFSFHCADPKYHKTWIRKRDEEITYRSRSFDSGDFYDFKVI